MGERLISAKNFTIFRTVSVKVSLCQGRLLNNQFDYNSEIVIVYSNCVCVCADIVKLAGKNQRPGKPKIGK